MKKEKVAYPAFIKQCGEEHLVYIPDLELYTEGKSLADAIMMARDAIGLTIMHCLENKLDFPEESLPEKAMEKAKLDADETFDYSDGIMSYIDVDCIAYMNRLKNRAIKKNCTIPYWLNEQAEKAGINFSQLLKEALMQKLNIV